MAKQNIKDIECTFEPISGIDENGNEIAVVIREIKNNKDFHFRKLSDFEQLLFREKQVQVLTKSMAKRNFEIGQMTSEINHLHFDYGKKIKNLSKNIEGEKRRKNSFKKKYAELLVSHKIIKNELKLKDKELLKFHKSKL